MAIVAAAIAFVGIRLLRRDPVPAPQPAKPAVAVPAAASVAESGAAHATNTASAAAVPPVQSSGSSSQMLASVRALVAKGDLNGARGEAFVLLGAAGTAPDRAAVEELLGEINVRLAFSQAPMEEKTNHVIKAGEGLDAIARRYKASLDLVQVSNGIRDPARIRKDAVLRIVTGTWRIEVLRSSHELVVYLNDRFFKRYHVGTGKHEKTPVGAFVVVDRVREPVWWHPDGRQIPFGNPENILGTRWLALKATGETPELKGYGIHGTWDDSTIGKSESAGCVRMRNRDVEELFTLVPVGTAVRIVDK